MTINEAKMLVEKENPNWRVISCTPLRNLYIFGLAGKNAKPYWRTARVWTFPVGLTAEASVDIKTGKINNNFNSAFDLSEEESDEYDSAEIIYYEDLTPPKE